MPRPAPKKQNALPTPSVTDKKDCLYYLIIYAVLLILNFAAYRSAPEMWPLTGAFAVWCLWLPYRIARDYRKIQKTGKPLVVSPAERLRDAYHVERWNGIVVSSLALLGSVYFGKTLVEFLIAPVTSSEDAALNRVMTSDFLYTLAVCWVLPACIAISAWFARKRYQKTAQAAVVSASSAESESVAADAPKHWWTSSETREDIQQTRRKS